MALPIARSSFPEIYERALVGPLFRPWAEALLDDVVLTAGDRVLDVACGTGIVARLARQRLGDSGQVVGVDASPPMLEMARSVDPRVDWRVGDAGALPLQDGDQFDVVLCQQGLQFFPDKPAAAREMFLALADGGRLALSTWRPDDTLPVLLELRRIAERQVGAVSDRRHGFGDPDAVEDVLREAGLRDVRSRIVSRTVHFEDGASFVRLNALALVGMSPAAAKLSDEEHGRVLEAITRDSAGVVQAHTGKDGFTFEIAAVVATARA